MQKAAALLAIATVAMASDKPSVPNNKDGVTTIRFGFDDAVSRTIYQSELVDPMIIKPSFDIDPKILIRPRYDYNIDPKMIIRPTYPKYPTYYYADDEELNVVSKIKEDAKKAVEFVSEHPELVIKAIEIIQKLHHHDEELNFSGIVKKVGKEAKKGLDFAAEHPQIIAQASKFLAHDDDEFFNLKEGVEKAGKFIVEHPEVVRQVEQKVEQVINKYKGNGDLLKQDAKKALDYVAQHPEVIKQVAQLVKNMAQHDDDEFFNVQEGVEKAGKFITEHPDVIKQVLNKYKGRPDLLKQDAKKAFDFISQRPEIMKQVNHVVKNLGQLDDDELFAEPIYPIREDPKKKKFLGADDEDNELNVLGQMIKEGVKNQNGPKNSDFGKKRIVSFDELNVDGLEKLQFFEDNDLMCISLVIAGKPIKYCK